jgi:large subunit ribosomal protein L7Ae
LQSSKGAKAGAAKAAPAKKAAASAKKVTKASPHYPSAPKNFRVGGDVQPQREVSRFVRWPRYVRVQRQKKILYERLKTPPAINQFRKPLDRAEALPLFKLLAKYRPETKAEKKVRLETQAKAKAAGSSGTASKAPVVLKFGLNHITYLIEQGKAKFVAIAADVDPVELVLWLPALCRKMKVPYAIVNNKGRLGTLVHQKKATAVALTNVNKEDDAALEKIVEVANAKFTNNSELRRKWGGGIMGLKTQRKLEKREKMVAAELAKKALL